MTFAEWMKKQAEGTPSETPQQPAAKRPLSSGEIGWGVLGGGGGALLGWTLARLLHRKPSLRTKLLYSVLGAAGGVGGSRYLLTHMKDSQGRTLSDNAYSTEQSKKPVADVRVLNNKQNDMLNSDDPAQQKALKEQLAAEQAERDKVPLPEALSDRTAAGIGAGIGFTRGLFLDTKDPKGRGLINPGKHVAEGLRTRHFRKVRETRELNKTRQEAYDKVQAAETELTKNLQQKVDQSVPDEIFRQTMNGAGPVDLARARQGAMETHTVQTSFPGKRMYEKRLFILNDDGTVKLFNPAQAPKEKPLPKEHKIINGAAARMTNATANAATHALAAALVNRGYKHLIYNPLAKAWPTISHYKSTPVDIDQKIVHMVNEESGNN